MPTYLSEFPMPKTRSTNKAFSLSRVPALALGTFLVIAGLYFIYMEHGFPPLSQFPNGTAQVNGKAFFHIFALNGWSGELTVAGGALLLIGSAQHHLAKLASFIVAVVFAGVGIWAVVNHHSALGLFAANIWTILLWFAAAAYLLINTVLPRTGGSSDEDAVTRRTEPLAGTTDSADLTTTQV
jgi:hypothetical protein